MNCSLPITTLLFLLLWPQLLSSQSHPAFGHYSTEHGLPSAEVYEVLQDKRGYLWFGTDNGVSRFNGYEFENFGPEQGLKDVVVYYLLEDDQERIWMVSGSENLYFYDYEVDSIQAYRYNAIIQENMLLERGAFGFYVTQDETVYRSLGLLGVIRIDSSGNTQILPEADYEGNLIVKMVGAGYFTVKKTVPDKNKIEQEALIPFNFYEEGVLNTHFIPGSDQIWGVNYLLALSDGALLCYVEQMIYLFEQQQLQWNRADFFMASALEAANGHLYLGGHQGTGVRVYEGREALDQNEYTTFLEGYTVSHVLEDRKGGFWFTTTQDGVFYSADQNFMVYDQASGLPENNIVNLVALNRDTIIVATRQGDLLLINDQTNEIKILNQPWEGLEVNDLKKDNQSTVWIGTTKGLFSWDRLNDFRDFSTTYTHKKNKNRKNIGLKKLVLSPNTNYFYLLPSFGFARYRLEGDTIDLFSRNIGIDERIYSLLEDPLGRLLVGKNDGLFQFEGDTLIRPQSFFPTMELKVEAIAALADSTLVIGTKGGGVLLWKEDHFQAIGEREGLSSGMVENLHIDAAQNIWVGTLSGLNKIVAKPQIRVETITTEDGLPSNEINAIDSYGDQIWVATRGGLVKLPPETKQQQSSPAPMLDKAYVNGVERELALIEVLPFRENSLRFQFLTINYNLNGRIQYRYRLGTNAPWVYTQNRQVDLAALSSGRYQFEVQSQNKDGQWSASTVLPFRIRPPFWGTWWFWTFVVVLAGGITYSFYRNRMKLLQNEALFQKERAEAEQTKAALEKEMHTLQATALRAQMNPHFIFNCLNSIQSFIAIGDKTNAMRYLSRFAKLVRGALDSSLNNRISLDQETQMLDNYLALEQMRFDRKFNYELSISNAIDREQTQLPPLLVQPFVENAIIHGLSDTSRDGKIKVHYEQENNHLKITVTDNGIGITAAKKKKKDNPSLYKSVGMTITSKRLALLDQSEREESLKVEELKGADGRITGTRVTVWVEV